MLKERRMYHTGQNAMTAPSSHVPAPTNLSGANVESEIQDCSQRCEPHRKIGTANVAPYAATRGPVPDSARRAGPRTRKVAATSSSYNIGGSNMRPTL